MCARHSQLLIPMFVWVCGVMVLFAETASGRRFNGRGVGEISTDFHGEDKSGMENSDSDSEVDPFAPLTKTELIEAIELCVNSTSEISVEPITCKHGDLSTWEVNIITDMSDLFNSVRAFNADIGAWDTSSVTSMDRIFENTQSFDVDIGDWDTAQVTTMSFAFSNASLFNQDLSRWDVSRVTTLEGVFKSATSYNTQLNSWDTSRTVEMGRAFYLARSFDQSLADWDVGNVVDLAWAFKDTESFDGDLSGWDTARVTDISRTFAGATAFDGMIGGWDVARVAGSGMTRLFHDAASYTSADGLSNWDTDRVTDLTRVFEGAVVFNGNISGWNVGRVTEMRRLFMGAEAFAGDLRTWDTSRVVDMRRLFYGAQTFSNDVSKWDTGSVTMMDLAFSYAHAFNSNISSWDVSKVTTMEGTFSAAPSFDGELSDWDTAAVTTMYGMFTGSAFDGDLSSWDTSAVTTIFSMFYLASLFNSDLSGWDTAKMTNTEYAFDSASAFNGDLSSWDTARVESMRNMFAHAASFSGTGIGSWDVSSVTSMDSMFDSATSIFEDLSDWNTTALTSEPVAMFDGTYLGTCKTTESGTVQQPQQQQYRITCPETPSQSPTATWSESPSETPSESSTASASQTPSGTTSATESSSLSSTLSASETATASASASLTACFIDGNPPRSVNAAGLACDDYTLVPALCLDRRTSSALDTAGFCAARCCACQAFGGSDDSCSNDDPSDDTSSPLPSPSFKPTPEPLPSSLPPTGSDCIGDDLYLVYDRSGGTAGAESAATCNRCGTGNFTSGGNLMAEPAVPHLACLPCPAGRFCDGGSSTPVCPGGTYSTGSAQTCTLCPAGKHLPGSDGVVSGDDSADPSLHDDPSDCVACAHGGEAYDCGVGHHRVGLACNPGSTTDPQACSQCTGGSSYTCYPGFFKSGLACQGTDWSDTQTCDACPPDSFNADSHATACQSCPPNTNTRHATALTTIDGCVCTGGFELVNGECESVKLCPIQLDAEVGSNSNGSVANESAGALAFKANDAFKATDGSGDGEGECTAIAICPAADGSNDDEGGSSSPTSSLPCFSFDACGPGFFMNVSAVVADPASSCLACMEGTFSDGYFAEECLACLPGKATAFKGSTGCHDCRRGYYAAHRGLTTCQVCLPGSYTDGTGSAECTPCPPGSASNMSGMPVPCPLCAPGTSAATSASVTCTVCSPGAYADVQGATACKPCPAGSYQPNARSALCSPCEPGSFQPAIGQSACRLAQPGHFVDAAMQTRESSCVPGTHATSSGASSCAECMPGYYQPSEGGTDCVPASPGFHVPAARASAQISCESGSFSAHEAATDCDLCRTANQSTSWSMPGSSACGMCITGYYRDDTAGGCIECVEGMRCDKSGVKVANLALEAGFWRLSPSSGRSSIERCPGNGCMGGNGTADALCAPRYEGPACAVCSAGNYKTTDGSCLACSGTASTDVLPWIAVISAVGLLMYKFRHRMPTKAQRARLSLVTKAKIVVVFGQIIVTLPWVLDLGHYYPECAFDFNQILLSLDHRSAETLTWLSARFSTRTVVEADFNNILKYMAYLTSFDVLTWVPLGCIGLARPLAKLLIAVLTPPIAAIVVVVVSAVLRRPTLGSQLATGIFYLSFSNVTVLLFQALRPCRRSSPAAQSGIRFLASLVITFCSLMAQMHFAPQSYLPLLHSRLTCLMETNDRHLEHGKFMASDLSIDCESVEYFRIRLIAYVGVAVYPIALPLWMAARLATQRQQIAFFQLATRAYVEASRDVGRLDSAIAEAEGDLVAANGSSDKEVHCLPGSTSDAAGDRLERVLDSTLIESNGQPSIATHSRKVGSRDDANHNDNRSSFFWKLRSSLSPPSSKRLAEASSKNLLAVPWHRSARGKASSKTMQRRTDSLRTTFGKLRNREDSRWELYRSIREQIGTLPVRRGEWVTSPDIPTWSGDSQSDSSSVLANDNDTARWLGHLRELRQCVFRNAGACKRLSRSVLHGVWGGGQQPTKLLKSKTRRARIMTSAGGCNTNHFTLGQRQRSKARLQNTFSQSSSRALLRRLGTPLVAVALTGQLDSIGILFDSYRVWWWIIVESLHRIAMGGLLVLFQGQDVLQTALALFLSVSMLVVYAVVRPEVQPSDDELGITAHWAIVNVVMVSGLLKAQKKLSAEAAWEDESVGWFGVVLSTFVIAVPLLVFVVLFRLLFVSRKHTIKAVKGWSVRASLAGAPPLVPRRNRVLETVDDGFVQASDSRGPSSRSKGDSSASSRRIRRPSLASNDSASFQNDDARNHGDVVMISGQGSAITASNSSTTKPRIDGRSPPSNDGAHHQNLSAAAIELAVISPTPVDPSHGLCEDGRLNDIEPDEIETASSRRAFVDEDDDVAVGGQGAGADDTKLESVGPDAKSAASPDAVDMAITSGHLVSENTYAIDQHIVEEAPKDGPVLLGGDWVIYNADDDDGEPYYYNVKTGVTTWERPACV